MTSETGKLTFHVFTDKSYTQEDTAKTFVAPINPEQLTRSFKIEHNKKQAAGTQEFDPKMDKIKPQTLSLAFTLDGTGVVPDKQSSAPKTFLKDVPDQVERMLTAIYVMDGSKHKPAFVKVIWGRFIFKGLLSECQINYTLFSPEGVPLRAKVSTKFLGYVEQSYRLRKENKQSPDITHLRKVKAGDRLDRMAYDVYGDATYYLELARANGLTSPRRLSPNVDLLFPPIDKTNQ